MTAKILSSQEGEVVSGVGGSVRLLLEGDPVGVWIQTVPPGSGPPLHLHEDADEAALVLSGEFEWTLAGEVRRLSAGGFLSIPRGVHHRFVNVGETDASFVAWVTPAGFEGYFRQRVHLDPSKDAEALRRLAQSFGMTVVG
ncbi:cupin domain-containing protein [Fimbriimonas ginsengisoli]|uniref:Cupin type-2 domain-containing protein n=1 Tax=Fimbriimonas ginsengisoli Gsoil 348 TaxID=661478 RepID=A0A068NP33_FIMGI|nr:cupin domain-containing protein [Fimbriimonas ginsengisoli]AIE85323.1 hypothetical protein OP10G_1955 [Fimbriimonas ginsengisoli Gsoil 348]